MKKYGIITLKEGSYLRSDYKEVISTQENLLLVDIITDDRRICYEASNHLEAERILSEVAELFPGRFGIKAFPEKITFQDLNAPMQLRLVTEIVQEVDHVKFTEQCERILQENPETIQDYNIAPSIVKTNFGEAILLMAMIQYWTTEEGYKAWKQRLVTKSKLGM